MMSYDHNYIDDLVYEYAGSDLGSETEVGTERDRTQTLLNLKA